MEAKSFFRYPGGKSRLAKRIFEIIDSKVDLNEINNYMEPFVGGGSMFLYMTQRLPELTKCQINDKDDDIAFIWQSIQLNPCDLRVRLSKFTPSVDDYCSFLNELSLKADFPNSDKDIRIDRAFMKIALHQMSYSGLGTMAGSPIGGFEQKGKYSIGCRYNPATLIKKITAIEELLMRFQMTVSSKDCIDFLDGNNDSKNTLIYLDPPYYMIGNTLYEVGMDENEHIKLAEKLKSLKDSKWFISYDDCPFIRDLYSDCEIIDIEANYTINNKGKKNELLICPRNI